MVPLDDQPDEERTPSGGGVRSRHLKSMIHEHYEAVYRFAFRLSGNAPDAEDLTQQTFLTAFGKIDQLRESDKVRSWMFTIVRNAYLKSRRHQTIDIGAFEESLAGQEEPKSLNANWDEEQLQHALDRMPESYRTPVLLFYFEELSYKEIAQLLEVPMGTVMSRLSRGKQFLRCELSQEGDAPPASE